MGLISRILNPLIDRRIESFQSEVLAKHVVEVENIYRQMNGWRHDYHNHIQTAKAHLKLMQYSELEAYFDKLDQDLRDVDTIVKTGNTMVDAIFNSKLSLARSYKINLNAKAVVPKTLPFSGIDLCVVVGNLMDNAIEACVKLDENSRFIRVYSAILKNQLYISVTNSSPSVIKKEGFFRSTKKRDDNDPTGHGLSRIDKICAKYGGFVNRQCEEGVFATEVLLPIL